MSKKVTTLSPKLFIGMDIHKKSWEIHCCTDITIGHSKSMPPDSKGLQKYIHKNYPNHCVAIAYEAGCCGFGLARDFIDLGWDTFVVNPADIPRPAKMAVTKTDKIDAKNLARQLRSGNLTKITIPSTDREALRSLTRQRSALVRDARRIKSRIKSLLLYYEITIPDKFDNPNWTKAFIKWIQAIPWSFPSAKFTFQSMIQQQQFIDQQTKEVSNFI